MASIAVPADISDKSENMESNDILEAAEKVAKSKKKISI